MKAVVGRDAAAAVELLRGHRETAIAEILDNWDRSRGAARLRRRVTTGRDR